MSQQHVAALVGVDRSLVSRMELGHGGGIAFDTWMAVCGALGLQVDLMAGAGSLAIDHEGICRRTLADLAAAGGWISTESLDETLLTRANERVVVRVWETVTVVPPEIDVLRASMAREGANGLVVIPATGPNRRRISESRAELRGVFPTAGNRWYVALISRGRPMPNEPGILWAHPDCLRLRVAGNPPGWMWTKVGDGPRFATGRRDPR